MVFFRYVHCFYFLGSNNRQQSNDEENQLLWHRDKESDCVGAYTFERNVQDKNISLQLVSSFSLFKCNEILIC